MKITIQFLKFIGAAMFCCGLLFSCRKNDEGPDDPVDSTSVVINADTISNHLRFFNATKKQGTIPKGPAGSSLQISFKDTLTLTELARPVNFLHKDTTVKLSVI